jgi:hypothetical protein
MASEYRFDYSKAKPNRFAEKMNLNVGWTVEKFVAEERKEERRKTSSPKGKKEMGKKPAKKPEAPPKAKTRSLKAKSGSKKPAAKLEPAAKKKK